MIDSKFLSITFSSLPGVIIFVELFLLLPLTKRARHILEVARKAISVINSPRISDHWKEKAVPGYSRQLMTSTLASTFFLLMMFLGFLGAYCTFGLLFMGSMKEVIATFSQPEMHIVAAFLGMVYAFFRNKLTKSKIKSDADYTFLSKVLHHIIFDIDLIREMAFDIDCAMVKWHPTQPIVGSSPVYIA